MKRDDRLRMSGLADKLLKSIKSGPSSSCPSLSTTKMKPVVKPINTQGIQREELIAAAEEGDVYCILTNIKDACDIKLASGKTLLHSAAENGQSEIVRVLLCANPAMVKSLLHFNCISYTHSFQNLFGRVTKVAITPRPWSLRRKTAIKKQ